MMHNVKYIVLLVFAGSAFFADAQQLYEMQKGADSRLSSFENPNGIKGQGAKTNKTAKGNAFEVMQPGETKSLMDIKGEGMIQRIWMTIDQSPVKLRSLRLQFFWDNSNKPAADVPMGDFFGYNTGKQIAFQSAFFSSGEVKMYLDGDSQYPTIAGTGAEDYIGSAWGLGEFTNMYQGCTVASDSTRQYNFYRWHIPDAIFFNKDIKVTLQQIGGWGKNEVLDLFI